MKSLYKNKFGVLTSEGHEIDREFNRAIKPIFKKYADKGYLARDLTHTILFNITLIEAEYNIMRGINERKAEREKKAENKSGKD